MPPSPRAQGFIEAATSPQQRRRRPRAPHQSDPSRGRPRRACPHSARRALGRGGVSVEKKSKQRAAACGRHRHHLAARPRLLHQREALLADSARPLPIACFPPSTTINSAPPRSRLLPVGQGDSKQAGFHSQTGID